LTDDQDIRPNRLIKLLRKWEYWMGAFTVIITIGLTFLIIRNWQSVDQIAGYGYVGGLVISALGCITWVVPIPMVAVQFTLGSILQPWFGPLWLGPLFVGLVCSFGEATGSLSIYAAGYSGGTGMSDKFTKGRTGRFIRIYQWLMRLMHKRGGLVIFVLSASMNPFFFPAALSCGAARFGLKKYYLITFAGKFIKCSAIAYAGYFGLRIVFQWLGIDV